MVEAREKLITIQICSTLKTNNKTLHSSKSIKMRLKLLFGLLMLSQLLTGQTFTEVTQSTPFEGVYFSSIAFADVNGDSTPDVLITGRNNSGTRIAKLYLNDGMGGYSEAMGTPFEGVDLSSIAFADVDGDNDQDVLITGRNGSGTRIAKLYLNDGMGSYTEAMGTPFVTGSSIAVADVDGDNDQDVLITGLNNSFTPVTKLYLNDGMGSYSEAMSTPFDGVTNSSIAVADVDGDNDQDVLITGGNSSGVRIAKLYLNDGMGSYTEAMGTPFEGVNQGSVAFADVDGDSDQDVLITGLNSSANRIAKLYLNNGMGSYTEAMGTPFEGVDQSSVAFADVDGDSDLDVLITGARFSAGSLISKLYLNDGTGVYSEVMGTPFESVELGSIAFADVDGDSDPDVLITGLNNSFTPVSKLYRNDRVVSSTEDLKIGINLDFVPFPNPSTPPTLYLTHNASEIGEVTLRVYNGNRVLLIQQRKFALIGQQTFSINIASLAKGTYFIELSNGKRRGVAQFVVQ